MPINAFGNSSNNSEQKIDTSLFEQKPYLRINYIESNIDQDIDLKNQYRTINIPLPINDKDIVSKNYIDNKIVDIIKRNIQNDEYISFLDNDNFEYKLKKYKPRIQLTDTTLFNSNTNGSNCANEWNYFYSDRPTLMFLPHITNQHHHLGILVLVLYMNLIIF